MPILGNTRKIQKRLKYPLTYTHMSTISCMFILFLAYTSVLFLQLLTHSFLIPISHFYYQKGFRPRVKVEFELYDSNCES